jgi:hypothetical protein
MTSVTYLALRVRDCFGVELSLELSPSRRRALLWRWYGDGIGGGFANLTGPISRGPSIPSLPSATC